ncbi:hypothetical protein V5N11_020104 [Cardamine amara subsp. amara]|uniref:Uncharacterized protein n=1 Tax=Cardamine amara subsp. amara TaxID=228776 RepID=A0ABD1AZG3_CARAN
MSEKGDSNFERFLELISPNIVVNFHNQSDVGSSSSRDETEESVRKPYISLEDICSAYEEWSCYAMGVPLKLTLPYISSTVTKYYVPYLSAIQIFTNKPVVGGSSSRSFGTDSYLYFQYNETKSFDVRPCLIAKVDDLVTENPGLESLTSSDLSQNSWFSIAWSPLYSIPLLPTMKSLSVLFLTYHSLTPEFPETFPQEETVRLPAFGVVTSELSGNVWNMPMTSDQENINMLEESAVSWLEKLRFSHYDFNMFMAEKSNAQMPLPREW